MKRKLLFFVLAFCAGLTFAQDTINYLLITETRMYPPDHTYLELTNKGDQPVQLGDFKLGMWGYGNTLDYVTGKTNDGKKDVWLPVDTLLPPGETFVFVNWNEHNQIMYEKGFVEQYSEKTIQDNMLAAADYIVYTGDSGEPGDTITPGLEGIFREQWANNGYYLEYHWNIGTELEDSAVVDQIGGVFNLEGGLNPDRSGIPAYAVAGITEAAASHYLIRRNSVTTGTLNWNEARGIGLDDSEWIPIPINGNGPWRLAPWTIGNQGDYNLTENTLESDEIIVDFANLTLTVPWGVRRGDDIMSYFVEKPGIGWEYVMGPTDSLSHAAHTGDQLKIYVAGNDLDVAAFDIIVEEPAANTTIMVPVSNEDPGDYWKQIIEVGNMAWPRVTQNVAEVDTIWGHMGGIPYATRKDSLLKRLEIASNASWEIIYVGEEKPDLTEGDRIRVTAEDGTTKDYYIKVLPYIPSHNARLSAVTWPDIPEFYKGLFGWKGDTIPNFGPNVFNYNFKVPRVSNGIPALIGMKDNVNSKVSVKRATNLYGTQEERTVRFTVTAEDDTTINVYNIVLYADKLPGNQQSYTPDPFISEVVKNMAWTGSDYLEIYNPGNVPLDLSNYMLVGSSGSSAEAISATNAENWMNRYNKYIPGYKWQSEAEWGVESYIAVPDLSVNKLVEGGDVFVIGDAQGGAGNWPEGEWPAYTQVDVHFADFENNNYKINNQWGETWGETIGSHPANGHFAGYIYLFKIQNDSVKQGLKPATDPNDFELIDVMGEEDGSTWVRKGSPFSVYRKPEISHGDTIASGVMIKDESGNIDPSLGGWINVPVFSVSGWPAGMQVVMIDIGKHYAITPTTYMSTISSNSYIVSEGFSLEESILGVKQGTTVAQFEEMVTKAHPDQTFTFTATADGSELGADGVLSNDDALTVLSADSVNTTKYILRVTDEGLSNDAVLTSLNNKYPIDILVQPTESIVGGATISGIPMGTTLRSVYNNVRLPLGAKMEVVDAQGAYLSFKVLNYDTNYVDVLATPDAFFNVIAEDGSTTILYQLLLDGGDAYITSLIFSVEQETLIIKDVPAGISTQAFINQLVPAVGASIQIIDKSGFERTDGYLAADDKVKVTSADGETWGFYFINQLLPNVVQPVFMTSNNYSVNQTDFIVTLVLESNDVSLSEFESNITISPGATLKILDESGAVKTEGTIAAGDQVVLSSSDGSLEVKYIIEIVTDINWTQSSQISLFPNPTNSDLNITGLTERQTVQVINSVGNMIISIDVDNSMEVISLDQYPTGFYVIIVSEDDKMIGQYKVVKMQ